MRFQSLSSDTKLTWDTIDYSYDSLSRLIEADYNFGDTVYSYGYDVAGNMVDYNGTTRTYNAANQLTGDGTNTYEYDNNGNLRTVGSDTYSWDRANRLLSVGNHSYVYDGLGNRVQQTVDTVVTDYLNDVQPGLTKLLKQDDGTNVEHFVHAPRGIHAIDDGTDWNFYMQDGLGSVRAMVDASAVVQSSMSFDPYGNPMGAYGAGFLYAGELIDSNGLSYNRARYYSPELGTWTAQDFLETPNRYEYVSGNPVMNVDPTGLFDWNTFRTQEGDCLYCIGREAGVITDTTDALTIRQWLETMQRQNIEAIIPGTECDPSDISCDPRLLPNERIAVAAPHDMLETARNGYGYGQYCQSPYSQNACNREAAPTATPTATSTPMPTATATQMPTFTPTCTPTLTVTPRPTATEEPRKVLLVGWRFDISGTLAGIGQDLNAEIQFFPQNLWPTRWFRDPFMGIAFTTARPLSGAEISSSGSGINFSTGPIAGLINSPEHGQISRGFTFGSGVDPIPFFMAPTPLETIEGDITVSGTDVIAFVGLGDGLDTNALPYSIFADVNSTSRFYDPGQWIVETVRSIGQ